MSPLKIFGSMLAAAILCSTSANAVSIGYKLVIDGSGPNGLDTPTFTLTNQSGSATIVNMMFSIGEISYNFDFASNINGPAGGSVTFNMPDLANGGLRSNIIDVDFSGFDPSEAVNFSVDIDPDSSDGTVNFKSIFFNNPGSQNSMLFVSFSGGSYLTTTIPDYSGPASNIFTFLGSQELVGTGPIESAVPIPGTLAIVAAGLVGIGITGRQPRKARR
jgi:hypothetical protein